MEDSSSTIMIIEDESLLLEAIDRKLASRGYKTLPYVSAEEGLAYLKDSSHNLPNLIWLDYYLGGMDGGQFMVALKEDERLKNIPVIVVSNSASDQKKNNMIDLGVKAYILKAQYKLDDIIVLLENVLKDESIQPAA